MPVTLPPKETALPLLVIELFCNCELVKPVPSPPTVPGKVTVAELISKVSHIFTPVMELSAIFVDVTACGAN